jgi:RND family efflux transporter MFP subunit
MKTRIVVALVVLALAAGVAWRLQQQGTAGTRAAEGDRAIAVRTVPVAVREFPVDIARPGPVEAAQQVALVAQVGGVVLRQHVQEGDGVRAGQILFSLDARPAQARIEQARAALVGARAEMAEAEKKLARLVPLQTSGYISHQEYDDARLVLEAARARAGTAEAEMRGAQLDVQYAQLRAPIAGRIGRIAVREGSLVQAGGEALTTILAPGTLDVRAAVAAQDWPALAAAHARGRIDAEVFDDAANAAPLRAELVFADAQLDAATGTVPVKLRLAGAGALLSGQGVRVRLVVGTEPGALVVPEAALQHGQQEDYVYVVRDGRAALQPVRLLRRLDGEVALAGELRGDEPVLTEIPKRLKAGSAVKQDARQ